MSYRYVTSTEESVVTHADHIVEGWNAYVNDISDAPSFVTGSSSGLCCHTCETIIIDTTGQES